MDCHEVIMENFATRFEIVSFTFLALVIFLMMSCGDGDKSPSITPSINYEGGRSGCAEFRSVVSTARQGVINDAELLEKLKTIASQGSTAEPDIRAASAALLETATQGEVRALAEATEAMVDACGENGY